MGPRAEPPPIHLDEADVDIRALSLFPPKTWQALDTEWMEYKGVGLEVLEASSRSCSLIQAYLPDSLLSYLGLYAPHARVLTTFGQPLPPVDSSGC